MNVRLQYDFEFLGAIYHESQVQLNQYNVSMNLLTKSMDHSNTNIAMDRIKAFVFGELNNSVFLNQTHSEQAEMLHMLGCNVTTLPEDPVDQIIGMMLYYKFNAIMEDRMSVTGLSIQSYLGDSVWYQHDEDDPAGPFSEEGWWSRANCQHHELDQDTVSENVVKVVSHGWREYGLQWPEESNSVANTVVFANFPRNES